MTKRSIATFSALAVAALAGTAFAGTPVVRDNKTAKEVKEIVKESCITGDLGVDFTSNYISRGIPQENQGVIGQPYLDLYFKLYEGSGALTKVSLNLGAWSSIHSHKNALNGPTTTGWYEFDYSAGFTFQFGNFSVTPSFLAILSPSDVFADNYNAQVTLAYDDSEALGNFALHPHVTVLFELEGKAGSGPDTGVYYEIGIAPSFKIGEGTLSIPVNLGLGSDGFYGSAGGGDDTYGYFSAGLALEWPLHFLPECLGQWSLKAQATYYNLGDNAAASGVPFVTDGDHDQYAFGGGFVVRF
jgi:hypothetical protein